MTLSRLAPSAQPVTTKVVVATFDVDCDGMGHAFHRVYVPHAALIERDYDSAFRYAVSTDQMSGFGDVCDVMTEREFLSRYEGRFDTHDSSYWIREGYWSYVDWR